MHSGDGPRTGIVYITDDATGFQGPRGEPYFGHWEGIEDGRPALLEEAAWWSVEEAVVWARARAEVVVVRLGDPEVVYSAGDQPPTGSALPWASRPHS